MAAVAQGCSLVLRHSTIAGISQTGSSHQPSLLVQ